jgi:hypothetical protein
LPLDPALIERTPGLAALGGRFDAAAAVYRVDLPRSALTTRIEGFAVSSALGLSARATLTGTRGNAVLLGDLPLREAEVNPALRALLDAGVVPTSLHNAFLQDSPRILSVHFEAWGPADRLAAALAKLAQSTRDLKAGDPPRADPAAGTGALDPAALEAALWKGEVVDGTYRLSLGRATTLHGHPLTEATGVHTWAAFVGSPAHTVVNGDVATLENELPFVLKALLDSGIRVVSIHTHLTQEKPRLVFVHFFGVGPLAPIARGVKEAFWLKEHFQSQ